MKPIIGNDHFLLQGFLPNDVMQGKHPFGQRSTGLLFDGGLSVMGRGLGVGCNNCLQTTGCLDFLFPFSLFLAASPAVRLQSSLGTFQSVSTLCL
jgi:hypothetical protein